MSNAWSIGKRTNIAATAVLALAGFFVACTNAGPATGLAAQSLGSACATTADCARFAPCVTGGSLQCSSGGCVAVGAQFVDLTCAEGHASMACGIVPQPEEQFQKSGGSGDLGICRWETGRPNGFQTAQGWFVAVADTPGSTVEVLEATVYGVGPNGDLTPIAGSAVGQDPVEWAGIYQRAPWFVPSVPIQNLNVTPGTGTFIGHVPTGDTLLHFGPARADVSHFVSARLVAKVRTTGDTKLQAGLDYWSDWSTQGPMAEGALGDWIACGAPVTLSTPRWNGDACTMLTGSTSASIEVTSPADGAAFVLGDSFMMSWTSTGLSDGSIRLVALCDGQPLSPTILGTAPANGTQLVTLPLTWPTGPIQLCATTTAASPTDCVSLTLNAPSPPPPSGLHNVVVRCDPKPGWQVVGPVVAASPDWDPGPAYEARFTLSDGQSMDVTFQLVDPNGKTAWAFDFSPGGSGVVGVPQCSTSVTVDGVGAPLHFAPNSSNPPGTCWYTNLRISAPGMTATGICY